jgi:hypothetical protein
MVSEIQGFVDREVSFAFFSGDKKPSNRVISYEKAIEEIGEK